jgi:hypothetical protein
MKGSSGASGHGPKAKKTSVTFNLTSVDYWEGIPHWEIPGAYPTSTSHFPSLLPANSPATDLGLPK